MFKEVISLSTQRLLPQIKGFGARARAWAQWQLTQRPALGGQIFPVSLGSVAFTSTVDFEGKRVCLFAHFQAQGKLLPSTVRYLRALSGAGWHVVCISTSPLSSTDVGVLRSFCHTLIIRENTGLDFASWKCATTHFPSLLKADTLLLANDSVFLVGDLQHVFSAMDEVECDFWGMTASRERRLHLQSYFLFLRKKTLQHPAFQSFWQHVGVCTQKTLIIRRWETTLTLRLQYAGLRGAAFVPPHWLPDAGRANPTLAHGAQLCEIHGVPLLKKAYAVTAANRSSIRHWRMQRRKPLPKVDVLLPTYNGNSYLLAQLESIISQRNIVPQIYLRDDNSTDETLQCGQAFATAMQANVEEDKYSSVPTMHIYHGSRSGIVGNVQHLLDYTKDTSRGYFALADQDDVWYPHKLHVQYMAMCELEAKHGQETPILICSDARGIDAQGEECFPSFLHTMRLSPHWGRYLRQVLVQSHALGCSCMGNAALRRLATPLPPQKDIFMHDWWLLLVATCFGVVECIDRPLLDYRQHEGNVLGAPRRASILTRWKRMRENSARTQQQAATFLQRYEARLSAAQRQCITAWAEMPQDNRLKRLYLCWRDCFGKPGLRWFLT